MKNVHQTEIRSAIAGKIRDLRRNRHWTQAELSKQLGLSQGRYSEIERGQGSFTAEQLLEILKLFNVPVSHFVGPQNEARPEVETAIVPLSEIPRGLSEASGTAPIRRPGLNKSKPLVMDWD